MGVDINVETGGSEQKIGQLEKAFSSLEIKVIAASNAFSKQAVEYNKLEKAQDRIKASQNNLASEIKKTETSLMSLATAVYGKAVPAMDKQILANQKLMAEMGKLVLATDTFSKSVLKTATATAASDIQVKALNSEFTKQAALQAQLNLLSDKSYAKLVAETKVLQEQLYLRSGMAQAEAIAINNKINLAKATEAAAAAAKAEASAAAAAAAAHAAAQAKIAAAVKAAAMAQAEYAAQVVKLSSSSSSFSALSVGISKLAKPLAEAVHNTRNLVATTQELITSEGILQKAVRNRILQIETNQAVVSGLNGVMAEQASLQGTLMLLENEAYVSNKKFNKELQEQIVLQEEKLFGSKRLEQETAKLTAEQMKLDAAFSATSVSLRNLAINSNDVLDNLSRVEAETRANYAATTALAAAVEGEGLALKQLTVELTAMEIATSRLNAEFAKQATLEAEILLLNNKGYSQLVRENKALQDMISLLSGKTQAEAIAINNKITQTRATEAAAAAAKEEAAALKKEAAEATIAAAAQKKLTAELNAAAAAEAKLAAAKASAQASYRAQAMTGTSAAQAIVGISATPSNYSSLLASQMQEQQKLQEMYNKEVGRGVLTVQEFTAADLAAANTMSLKNAALNKSHSLIEKTTSYQDGMTRSAKDLAESQKNLHSALRGVSGALGGLWMTYGNIIPLMIGFAAAASSAASVKLSADFEYTTKLVEVFGSSFGEASESADVLGDKLLAMKGLRKGPDELALGLKEFIKAGSTAEKAMIDLEEMTRFATLAEIDMTQAVKLVVSQSNAFANTSFADAANKIAVAAVASTTDIKELGTAMAYTTPLGSVLGFSFSEVATALALLANKGIESSKAGTSLTTTFTRLAAPASKAQKMLQELGVSFSAFDEDGHIKPMLRQLEELSAIFRQLGDEDRIKLVGALSDLRSMKGLGNLIQDIGDKSVVWDDMFQKVDKAAQGVTFLTNASERLDDTIIAKWEKFVAILKKLGTNDVVNYVSSIAIDTVTALAGALDMAMNPLDTFTEHVGTPLVNAVDKAGESIGEFIGVTNSKEAKESSKTLKNMADEALIAKVKLEKARVEPAPKQLSIYEILGIPNPLQAQAQYSAWSVFMRGVKDGMGELTKGDLIMSASKGATVPKDSFEQLVMINKDQADSVKAIVKAREDQANKEEKLLEKSLRETQRRIDKERELAEQERKAHEERVQQTNWKIATMNGIAAASKVQIDMVDVMIEKERLAKKVFEESSQAQIALREEMSVYLENVDGNIDLAGELAKLEKKHQKKVKDAGDDMELYTMVSEWYTHEQERIRDEAWKTEVEQLRATNSFKDGVKAALIEIGNAYNRMGDLAYAVVYDIRDALSDSMKAIFSSDSDLYADQISQIQTKIAELQYNSIEEGTYQMVALQSTYSATLRGAMAGNEEAFSQYMSNLDSYLAKAKEVMSPEEYAIAYERTMDDLNSINQKFVDDTEDQWNKLGKVWNNLWNKIKDKTLDTIADIMAGKAVRKLASLFSGNFSVGSLLGLGASSLYANNTTNGPNSNTPGYSGEGLSTGVSYLYGQISPAATQTASVGANAATGFGATTTEVATPGMFGTGVGGASWGSIGLAGTLGSLGYTYIGDAIGLPQGEYSGIGAGIGAAGGFIGGTALAGSAALAGTGMATGAAAGSVVPVVGTIIGAIVGGVAAALFGGDEDVPMGGIFTTNAPGTPHGDMQAASDAYNYGTVFLSSDPSQSKAWIEYFDTRFDLLEEVTPGNLNDIITQSGDWGRAGYRDLSQYSDKPEDLVRSIEDDVFEHLFDGLVENMGESFSKIVTWDFFQDFMVEGERSFDTFARLTAVFEQNSDLIDEITRRMDDFGMTAVEAINEIAMVGAVMGEMDVAIAALEGQPAVNAIWNIVEAWNNSINTLKELNATIDQVTEAEGERNLLLGSSITGLTKDSIAQGLGSGSDIGQIVGEAINELINDELAKQMFIDLKPVLEQVGVIFQETAGDIQAVTDYLEENGIDWVDSRSNDIASIMDPINEGLDKIGRSDVDITLRGITKEFDNYRDTLVELGASVEQLTRVEQARKIAISESLHAWQSGLQDTLISTATAYMNALQSELDTLEGNLDNAKSAYIAGLEREAGLLEDIANEKERDYQSGINLARTLAEAMGDEAAAAEILAKSRALELKSMDASLHPLQELVWGLEDAQESFKDFTQGIESIQNAIDGIMGDSQSVQSRDYMEEKYATLLKAAQDDPAKASEFASFSKTYLDFMSDYGDPKAREKVLKDLWSVEEDYTQAQLSEGEQTNINLVDMTAVMEDLYKLESASNIAREDFENNRFTAELENFTDTKSILTLETEYFAAKKLWDENTQAAEIKELEKIVGVGQTTADLLAAYLEAKNGEGVADIMVNIYDAFMGFIEDNPWGKAIEDWLAGGNDNNGGASTQTPEQFVTDLYASVGRGPVIGDAANQIDQEGWDYWLGLASSDSADYNRITAGFRGAVADYLTDNPRDDISDHVVDHISDTVDPNADLRSDPNQPTNTGGLTDNSNTDSLPTDWRYSEGMIGDKHKAAWDAVWYAYKNIGRSSSEDESGAMWWYNTIMSTDGLTESKFNEDFMDATRAYVRNNPTDPVSLKVIDHFGTADFNTGGSFTVHGPGGIDNLALPQLRVTQGEIVNVSRADIMAELVSEIRNLGNKGGDVQVKVFVGNKEIKDVTIETMRTDPRAQQVIRRAASV